MSHWKHKATRCAVIGCERTRVKGWSTCALMAHYGLGKSLYGAGRIDPIPADCPKCGGEKDNPRRGYPYPLTGCTHAFHGRAECPAAVPGRAPADLMDAGRGSFS